MLRKLAIVLALTLGFSSLSWSQLSTHTAQRFIQKTSAPTTCNVGDVYYNTTLNQGFLCTAANTWSQLTMSTGSNTLGGNLLFSPDNTYNIGAPADTRPASIYAAGTVIGANLGIYQISSPTFGSEVLTNGALTSGTSWSATNDCSLTSNKVTCSFSAGTASTITQTSANFATPLKANAWYKFTYTSSAVAGSSTANITTGIAAITSTRLSTRNSITAAQLYFQTNSSPGNFVISTTLTSGQAFTLDDLSLVPVVSGIMEIGGPLLIPPGSVSAPGIAFLNEPNMGFYWGDIQDLLIAQGGSTKFEFNGDTFAIDAASATINLGGSAASSDLQIKKAAAGSMNIVAATGVAVSGANAQATALNQLTELTTIGTGATTDTVIQIPANAIVVGVSVRVTATITGTSTFTVTGATSSTAFQTGTNVSSSSGSTDVGTKNCPYLNTTAQKIRITPNTTPSDTAGRVRVTIHYINITAPTS